MNLLPVCAADVTYADIEPDLNAQAAYLIDLDSGAVLYSRNASERREPASLTKVMTALLAIERGGLDEIVTVSQTALDAFAENPSAEYSTTADLIPGERMSLRDLLYCVLVASSGDACCVVAEAVSGSVDAFVERMNTRAAELGCTDTQFANPHGLHDDGHYTTAADLARIAATALQYDAFVEICNTTLAEIPETNVHSARRMKTTNYLLSTNSVVGYYDSRAQGVKTGFTSQAGYCLISSARNSKMTLLGVVMGCEATPKGDGSYTIQSFTDMTKLFDYGFTNFKMVTLLSRLEYLVEIPVTLADTVNTAVLAPMRSVETMLPRDYEESAIRLVQKLPAEPVEAPIEAGTVLGEVEVYFGDRLIDRVEMTAIADISRSDAAYWKTVAGIYWEKPWVKLTVFALCALVLLWLFGRCLAILRPRRR